MLTTLLVLTSFGEYGMTCQAQETELYPVRVNGKEGYIDATGRIVIKPQFDEVSRYFSEGLAKVKVGDKWGYIDKTGRVVINPQFDGAGAFSEGLAPVKIGEIYGYIDKIGRIVINPQFDSASCFSEGLAAVRVGDWENGKSGYIDKTGKYVINPQYGEAVSFSEGLACVMIGSYRYEDRNNQQWWFIDKNGKYYCQSYSFSVGFTEGLAIVRNGDKDGMIDRTGRFVINANSYNSMGYFKEGLSVVKTYNYSNDDFTLQNILTGFIDKTGRVVIKLQFNNAQGFSEGLSCVRVGGKYGIGRYGFIDKTGTYIINPQYNYAKSFKGGIAPVIINNQFQYIDKRGVIIWNSAEFPSYILEEISNFQKYDYYNLSY